MEFKREIARAAENSRTGKPIPRKIIQQFESTELAKDKEVEKVRLKNIHLKFQLRKMEGKIKEKEQVRVRGRCEIIPVGCLKSVDRWSRVGVLWLFAIDIRCLATG